MNVKRLIAFILGILTLIAAPIAAAAHEVYVLSPQEISQALTMTSPNPFTAVPGQELRFLGWGTLVAILVLIVLSVSISPLFERVFDPILYRLKKYAPFIARVTFGLSLFASGYYGAFFGPELPLSSLVPASVAPLAGAALMSIGILIVLGFLTRFLAFLMVCAFAYSVVLFHWYMLTYVNYLGEAILFVLLGSGKWSLDRAFSFMWNIEGVFIRWARGMERYSFLILRILFGTALFFASFYAKFIHSNLALDTVNDYHLTNYFPFTPLFLVLGAFIIEALLGFCFAAGFEVRFAAIFFTTFITLSLLFFGESVWPHLILFGVAGSLFCHGYDKYTLEKVLFQRKRKGEPIL